jgi:hypothetical protein
MSAKMHKARKTRRFESPAIPESIAECLDAELKHIVRSFRSVITAMPAESLGADNNSMRDDFIARRVNRWISEGPKCLQRSSVQSLLDIGFSKVGIIIPPAQHFVEVLTQVVSDGLTKGLENLLKALEVSAITSSDQSLKDMGLSEDGIEVFRRLLPSYSGTLDELLEVAAVL